MPSWISKIFGRGSRINLSVGERRHELSLLKGLVGSWVGDVDFLTEEENEIEQKQVSVQVEPSSDGWYIILNYRYVHEGETVGGFDVMGIDPVTGELNLTSFSGGSHESAACRIAGLQQAQGSRNWTMTLQTMGWSDGRTTQIRWTYELKGNSLKVLKERRLMNKKEYVAIASYRMIRTQ